MKKRKLFVILAAILAALLTIALMLMRKYTDNTSIGITEYKITDDEIPSSFDGYRIAQIADLHNTVFPEDNEPLLSLLRESDPDIIVFTGDQVDQRSPNPDVVLEFAKQAVQIAPCYLVTGNHEGSIPGMAQLNTELEEAGVNVLEDEIVTLYSGNDTVSLIGVNDPTMTSRFLEVGVVGAMNEVLADLCPKAQGYSILLAHHPEHLAGYAKHGVDLALCGHAHGGQVRLGDQGIIAPNQGLFPKYDAGQYAMDDTTMILSRGLGNSLFPWRINNPPELVVVELNTEA